MSKNEISIIVPVTQMHGKLTTMKNWLSQIKDPNIEIIIVHDYRENKTSRELNELVKSLGPERIKLIEGKYGSPGAARNAGLELASGTWLAFWDSDDKPQVEEFMNMYEHANHLNCKYAVGEFQAIKNESVHNYKFKSEDRKLLEITSMPGLW